MRSSHIALALALAFALALVACGGSPATGPGPKTPTPKDCPDVTPSPSAPALDEAAVKDRSHAFFDAVDRSDAAAITAVAAPEFRSFRNQRVFDKDLFAVQLAKRAEAKLPAHTRTWKEEEVSIGAASATFMGLATAHVPGEGGKVIDIDGWYTLVWVPDGASWKVAHYQWQSGGIDVERDLWNDIYRDGTRFTQKPNQLLVDTIKGRKAGAALDVGMGQGRNSIFLAGKGWKVTGIDISDEGIRIAEETAKRKKLKLETVQANMETWDFGTGRWDLVALIYEGGDHALIEKAKASLKPGGVLVFEFFSTESENMGIGGVKPGELAELFKDGFTILRDDVVEDIADFGLTKEKLARFVAEKNK